MKALFLTALLLISASGQAEIIEIDPQLATYAGDGFDNPILAQASQKILSVLLENPAHNEYYGVRVTSLGRAVFDIPDLPFKGKTLHATGYLQKCEIEEPDWNSPFDAAAASVNVDWNQLTWENATDVFTKATTEVADEFLTTADQNGKAQEVYRQQVEACGKLITDPSGRCDFKAFFKDFGSSVTLSTNSLYCPALKDITFKTLSITVKRISETHVEFSEVTEDDQQIL